MSFTDREAKLDELAAWIEGLEGTVKYCYKAEPDDAKRYIYATKIKSLVFGLIVIVEFIGWFIWCLLTHNILLAGLSGFAIILLTTLVIFLVLWAPKIKGNDRQLDEIELAFNAYGVVIRMCNDIGCSVCAYEWNDFDSIVEYPTALVGVKSGLSYVFPKRVFTEEGYNKFREFSYAAVGKKCAYKKFKR